MTSRDDVTRDVGGMWAVLSMEREASTAFTIINYCCSKKSYMDKFNDFCNCILILRYFILFLHGKIILPSDIFGNCSATLLGGGGGGGG